MSKKILSILLAIFVLGLGQSVYAMKIGLIDGANEVTVGVSNDAQLISPLHNSSFYTLRAMKPYVFKATDNTISIYLNSQWFNLNISRLVVKPPEKSFVSAKKRWYRGDFIIENRNNQLVVVNDVSIEDYILGVVPAEMPSKWSYEALKAQAIAARSYAIANRGKRANRGYDLKDTPEDQAYGGASSETASTNSAVLETKGVVITYNQKVIPAYYSASAGGHTTNSGAIWNKDLPYLKAVPSFDDDVKKNGHGLGMSQHGANNLAKQGYNAYQILAYYYNDIKFGKLDPAWKL
jgi:stage II sporulation protein D